MNIFREASFLIFLTLLLWVQPLVAQKHPIEQQVLNQINELQFTKSGKAVLYQEKGDFLVHILNEETFEVEQKLVRRGKGPGELPRASAFYLDQENNILYLAGFDRRIIGVSLSTGETLFEKTFSDLRATIQNDTPSMFIHEGYLFYSNTGQLNPFEPIDKPLPVVSMFDTASTKLVYNFSLDIEQLAFPNFDDLEKANSVTISTFFLRMNERLSLLSIKGIPHFYFFLNGEFSQRIELDPDFDVSFITSTREEFGDNIGTRTPSYINNLEKLDEEHVLISYGNIHQEEIPLGFSIF
jgi:hypothetical protein